MGRGDGSFALRVQVWGLMDGELVSPEPMSEPFWIRESTNSEHCRKKKTWMKVQYMKHYMNAISETTAGNVKTTCLQSILFWFTSSPAHPVLMVHGKQTWLAVRNGGSNLRLSLSTELLPRGRITGIEEEMGRWRDAGRIDARTAQ